MHGKQRKIEYVPGSLVRHIDRELKEMNDTNATRVEAMEHIARELDRIIIRRRRK